MQTKFELTRREFMIQSSVLSTLAMVFPRELLAERRDSVSMDPLPKWSSEPDWQTIAQVQEILFPAGDDIPGASDIGALFYLHNAIENPKADGEDREFIFKGVGWLNDLTKKQHKKEFVQINETQQTAIIESIVKSRAGRNWVSLQLTYILEALVSDPVYGGNREGIGWKWLQHQPGYPSPPPDKTWDKLLQRRYQL